MSTLSKIQREDLARDAAKSPEQLRAEASASFQAAEDSFQRSDTDGFLSQWASGLTGQLKERRARLAEAGGVATFKGLFRAADGVRIKARLVDGNWGLVWAVLDEDDRVQVWVKAGRSGPRSKLVQLGLEEREEDAPAIAIIDGRGTGLSGTAWVAVKRTDGGFPKDAVVF